MKVFALVDCNSFYVSCERLFRPDLKYKPVVVLSNNDGCAISRSDEAKKLGVQMGAPFHAFKHLMYRNELTVLSSNYALYGDISARVMKTFYQWTPDVEVYSIDESFLRIDTVTSSYERLARTILSGIYRQVGIPTCIGLGSTKVLAKVANRLAKSQKKSGVFSLLEERTRQHVLSRLPVEDVWGLGARSAKKLRTMGIHTAAQFCETDGQLVQRMLTVVGRRIQLELQGVSCLELELESQNKKQIISSRSFGRPVFAYHELAEAVSQYTSRAAEKLRSQETVCSAITVYIQTNPYASSRKYFSSPATIHFTTSTSSTQDLVIAALKALRTIYRQGYAYKKAIVMLSEITSKSIIQFGLFEDKEKYKRKQLTSELMDQINDRMGQGTVKVASCGLNQEWKMRSERASPCYTTKWCDLLTVKC